MSSGARQESTHLAIDLGAESGRAILGRLRDGRLSLEEVSRFRINPFTTMAACIGMRRGCGLRFEAPCEALRRAVSDASIPSESTPGASITLCWARRALSSRTLFIIGTLEPTA